MKKYIHIIVISFSISFSVNFCYAQGVAVNTTGNTADPSAMLDVNATNKGVLIPRVTSTSSITSPVVGLLIFQTSAPVGFYYYDGATWDYLQNSANTNVTLQGNTFNGNSQLLQLNSTGQIPALSGVNITNLNASNITSGTVPATNGGAGTVNGILTANGAGNVSAASTTGSGNVVVLASSPTLVTPNLGTPSTLVGTNITGTASNLTAGKVTTDANLTGDVTSTGNATTYNSIVPIAKGGTGTATPSLVAGTNVTLSGSWPNQTINASGGSSVSTTSYTAYFTNPVTSGTFYFSPISYNSDITANTSTTTDYITAPVAGTIVGLYIHSITVDAATTGNDVGTFTVFKNGTATSMTCSVTNSDNLGSPQNSFDYTHTFTVAVGDQITIRFVQTNGDPGINYAILLKEQ